MKISDTERREVAATMRTISCSGVKDLTLVEVLNSILTGGASRPTTEMAILARLADLIDRPTCHDDDEREQYPVYTDWLFKCSYCGWDGQIWKSVGFGDMSSCVTNYCPNCGEEAL